MDGTEDDTTHGAEEPLCMQKPTIHALCIADISILGLFRERVVLQPRQQFQIHGHTLVMHLRRMHMHVVHGRDEQTVAEIGHLNIFPLTVWR